MSDNGHTIRLTEPAASFLETFLIGNGRLGAAVHGHPGVERLDLNTDTFWSGGPHTPESADHTPALQQLRLAIRDGDHATAEHLAAQLRSSTFTEAFQPVGALTITYDPSIAQGERPDGYARELLLRDAETCTNYHSHPQPTTVTAFVPAAENVIVVELHGPGVGDQMTADSLAFECPHPDVTAATDHAGVRSWAGRAPAVSLPDYLGDIPDPVRYATDTADNDGTVAAGMGFAVAATVERYDADHAVVLLAVEDGFRGRHSRPSANLPELRQMATNRICGAGQQDVAAIRRMHRSDHRQWYDRTTLSIASAPSDHADGAAVEQFFNLGRYLLIASSRPGTQPANLQGLWNDDVRPGWSCNYTTNINVEMNYWPAAITGLGELTEPFTRFIGDLVAPGERTATAYYGLPGWTVHHNTDIWAFTDPVSGFSADSAHHANWPTGGLWLSNQVVDIASRGIATPARFTDIVDGSARFAIGLLEPGPDGRLVTNPSTSPEHDFVIGDEVFSMSAGSAMDQQLVEETLRNTITHSSDSALRTAARDALARLRPSQVSSAGVLLEWGTDVQPLDRGHRHLSHLVGVFPGRVIDADADPDLFAAAVEALRERVAHGSGHTGWSQSWIACLAAHTGDASLVAASLDILIRDLTSASLLDLHPVPNHWTGFRFQIDGNFGATAAIAEAIVQSRNERVHLLPAAPAHWKSGTLNGAVLDGGHTMDLSWSNGGVTDVSITAACATALQIFAPGVLRADGSNTTIRVQRDETGTDTSVVSWFAGAGDILTLRGTGAAS